MTAVFAVVGQHRFDPGRLLLLGDDGRYYAYDARGRPSPIHQTGTWVLDDGGRLAAGAPEGPAPAPCRWAARYLLLAAKGAARAGG